MILRFMGDLAEAKISGSLADRVSIVMMMMMMMMLMMMILMMMTVVVDVYWGPA